MEIGSRLWRLGRAQRSSSGFGRDCPRAPARSWSPSYPNRSAKPAAGRRADAGPSHRSSGGTPPLEVGPLRSARHNRFGSAVRCRESAVAAAPEHSIRRVSALTGTVLGTCTSVSAVDQNRIVSTVRSSEVVSDPTNVLALEAARRRQSSVDPVHLASCQRVLRAQRFIEPTPRRISCSSRWCRVPGIGARVGRRQSC